MNRTKPGPWTPAYYGNHFIVVRDLGPMRGQETHGGYGRGNVPCKLYRSLAEARKAARLENGR